MGLEHFSNKALESLENNNWEPVHSTDDWQLHFQTPSFDYTRYEQFKLCFDSFMHKQEEDKRNCSECLFPVLKRITVNFDIPLEPIHSKY